ncbi:MAG: hypothetical protein HY290_29025 [Planctomycetia bacterium]|nr:hypothetical protein [Planctomycetia bacterium]
MAPAIEMRYRVVEILSRNRRTTIDSDLAWMTARSAIELFKKLDPSRVVIVEADVREGRRFE